MGREIRRVPKNWNHPREGNHFQPLNDDYVGVLKYYKESVDRFIEKMTEVIKKGNTEIYDDIFSSPKSVYEYLNEDSQMNPPDINDYMPEGSWYQLYETVSEGTPLSPPFEKKEDLVEWLTNNKDYWDNTWTKKQAEAMVKAEWAPSGLLVNGKFHDSQESLLIDKQS